MRSRDITGVTGVPELTWCYNRNKDKAVKKTIECEITQSS